MGCSFLRRDILGYDLGLVISTSLWEVYCDKCVVVICFELLSKVNRGGEGGRGGKSTFNNVHFFFSAREKKM
jgi:hypothetical protein